MLPSKRYLAARCSCLDLHWFHMKMFLRYVDFFTSQRSLSLWELLVKSSLVIGFSFSYIVFTIKDELYIQFVFKHCMIFIQNRVLMFCFPPIWYTTFGLNNETSLTKKVLISDFTKQLGKISVALSLSYHSCKWYNPVSVIDQLDHLAYATPGGVTLQGFADTLFNQLSQGAVFNTDRSLRFSLSIHKSELICLKSHNYQISKLSVFCGSKDTKRLK